MVAMVMALPSPTADPVYRMLTMYKATFASKIELDAAKKTAQVTREIDGGFQVISVKLPVVITADLRSVLALCMLPFCLWLTDAHSVAG